MKLAAIVVVSCFLVGCAFSSIEFYRPSGLYGESTINGYGCSQIPNSFKYREGDSFYVVKALPDSIFLYVRSVAEDVVEWGDRTLELSIDGEIHTFEVSDLVKSRYTQAPCGGFADLFNCKAYQGYTLSVDIPNSENAKKIIVKPPVPIVNSKVFGVSDIEFKRVTEVLFYGLNC